MSNQPIRTNDGVKPSYIVGGSKLHEIIDHLNDLFMGKSMTQQEMKLLQHIVDDICEMSNENQLLRIYNQNQIAPYSTNH
jgi:hypothetical protein